jgi:hypothetical protein
MKTENRYTQKEIRENIETLTKSLDDLILERKK